MGSKQEEQVDCPICKGGRKKVNAKYPNGEVKEAICAYCNGTAKVPRWKATIGNNH